MVADFIASCGGTRALSSAPEEQSAPLQLTTDARSEDAVEEPLPQGQTTRNDGNEDTGALLVGPVCIEHSGGGRE
jgi:hypothetical protein